MGHVLFCEPHQLRHYIKAQESSEDNTSPEDSSILRHGKPGVPVGSHHRSCRAQSCSVHP